MEISLLYSLELAQLWELFSEEILDKLGDKKNQERYQAVEEGINIKYDIRYIINNIGIVPKIKSRKILLGKKTYDLKEFYKEIEFRKVVMRKWIKENMEGEELTKGASQDGNK